MVTEYKNDMNQCPIETSVKYIGKKWSVNILRDIFLGKHRFIDFLNESPKMSAKMLSTRLKELEENKLIEKRIISKTPIVAKYYLTDKGKALNNILYELSVFSINHYTSEIRTHSKSKKEMIVFTKQLFEV